MKILFLDVDGTLTTTKSGQAFKQYPQCEDIAIIDGVEAALNFHAGQGYTLIGVSNQGGVPDYKSLNDTILEFKATIKLLPQLRSIFFAPGQGEIAYRVSSDGIASFSQVDEESFRKPGTGMIRVALSHFSGIEDVWMVGDRTEDEDCARNALINFLPAHVWHTKFQRGINEIFSVTKKQVEFLEGVKLS